MNIDIFGGKDEIWAPIPIDASFPKYLCDNTDRFRHLISTPMPNDEIFKKMLLGAARQRQAALRRHIDERAAFKLLRRSRV